MKDIRSVLLDNSFVTRLLKSDDEYHQNTVEYFEYFLHKNIIMYLSTIVVSEYAVADNPDTLLSLKTFQILEFDYKDAKTSGYFFKNLKENVELRQSEQRSVIINDIKLFAQIHNRNIDAFITKDRKALTKMVKPLREIEGLSFEYIDLSIPLREKLGLLF
ncbi:hypothetical protein [Riemerella columbina]|uniref:hypothetical protein n=1 Tax=Riemerella columbina TaxID=103810 RepID=UPI000382772F|nr:hypothetical protein [Riemerella columbina]